MIDPFPTQVMKKSKKYQNETMYDLRIRVFIYFDHFQIQDKCVVIDFVARTYKAIIENERNKLAC